MIGHDPVTIPAVRHQLKRIAQHPPAPGVETQTRHIGRYGADRTNVKYSELRLDKQYHPASLAVAGPADKGNICALRRNFK